MEHIKGFFFILAAAALWGGIGPVAKAAFAEGLSPLEVAFWRAVIGWFFFALHALVIRKVSIARADLPLFLFFAMLCVTGFYGSYQMAVDLGGAARASVLLYTAPAWVAVMARVFLREAISSAAITGILACILGVALISTSTGSVAGHDFSWLGIFFGLISGFTYALYYIFGKKLFSRYHPVTVFAWILILGAAGLAPFVGISIPAKPAWPSLLFLGFFTTYLAYFVYSSGLTRLKASQAAVIATMEPVVAAFLAYVFWQENLGFLGYAGASIIVSGVILQAVRSGRKHE